MLRINALPLAVVILVGITEVATAQRGATTYQSLLSRSRQANAYMDVNALPMTGASDTSLVRTSFRLEYDYLNFTRSAAENDPNAEFGADVTLYVDVYKAGASFSDRTEQPDMDLLRSGMAQRRQHSASNADARSSAVPLATEAWKGSAKAVNYAQTISNRSYLEGFVDIKLPAGDYVFALSMREEGQSRIRPVGRSRYRVHDFSQVDTQWPIYVMKAAKSPTDPPQILGFGNQIPYGSDFELLLPISAEMDPNKISVKVSALEFGRKDTSVTQTLATIETEPEWVFTGSLNFKPGDPYSLVHDAGVQRWLRVPVAGSRFPNVPMRIEVFQDGKVPPIAQRMLQSKWVDIPTSLLNVSVAVDMMEAILEKEEFRRVRRLNNQEKESYFREYWNPKDPTPGTEFNELMVEYYRRIDIAYERFSSATKPGYESDQGKTFLLMGEPDRITRRFPPDQPVLEIWEYGDKQIVFQATTGFGDFQRVKPSN